MTTYQAYKGLFSCKRQNPKQNNSINNRKAKPKEKQHLDIGSPYRHKSIRIESGHFSSAACFVKPVFLNKYVRPSLT